MTYEAGRAKTPKRRYDIHKKHAQKRGVPFEFSFDEWWAEWQLSGKWEQRGRKPDQYCMARKGDIGPYAVGNVDIKLGRENNLEKRGKLTPEERAVIRVRSQTEGGAELGREFGVSREAIHYLKTHVVV
jgi:hypothetical protein